MDTWGLPLLLGMPGDAAQGKGGCWKELPSLRLTSAEVALPKALGPGSEAPAGCSSIFFSSASALTAGTVKLADPSPVHSSSAAQQQPWPGSLLQ